MWSGQHRLWDDLGRWRINVGLWLGHVGSLVETQRDLSVQVGFLAYRDI